MLTDDPRATGEPQYIEGTNFVFKSHIHTAEEVREILEAQGFIAKPKPAEPVEPETDDADDAPGFAERVKQATTPG